MINLIEGRIIERFAHIIKWHTIIMSGAYKDNKYCLKTASDSERARLSNAVGIMNNHVTRLGEIVERLPTE